MKKWIINKPDMAKVKEITSKTDLTQLCAEVLVSRGIKEMDDVVEFFNDSEMSDPFLVKDMQEAVDVIRNAIDEEKLICIYGDYDCDGITSTAILFNYLECVGANVMTYIPEREEGYGLNKPAIKKLSEQGIELIITVDNGISAFEEAEYIYELGMELVITDHHQPQETIPKAEAVVNPHRFDDTSPFKNLCGAGVAFKLVAALDDGNYEIVMEQYSDLACMGTIADVMPLVGENKIIVKRGLQQLLVTENEGLSCLVEKAGVRGNSISATTVAFMIAPRINAAGRFGSPSLALNALVSEEEDRTALVEELVSLNNQRKRTEEEIFKSIVADIEAHPEKLKERVLVISGEGWHHGIIGIISSKLIERFGKPNFIITIENGEARGSSRGVKGFNVVNCLNYCADILTKFGGHTLAGGFSLKAENIDEFAKRIFEYAKENNPSMPKYTINADKLLMAKDIDINQVESLKRLEPFGEGNPQPIFAIIGAKIDKIISLSNGRHTKFEIIYEGKRLTALLFNKRAENIGVNVADYIDLLVNVEINEYNGNKSVSLLVKDFRTSGINQSKYFSARDFYEAICRGEDLDKNILSKVVPDRNTLVELYKAIPQEKIALDRVFALSKDTTMNYCKLRLCVDVFCEVGLMEFDVFTEEIIKTKPTKKVDIETSEILKKLRCL